MKTRAQLLALPILIATIASCRDNRASIEIESICFPSDDCTFGATCDKQVIGFTTMDVSQVSGAVLFLQVANQLTDNANKDTGRTNTNGAHIDQVAVEYGSTLPRDVYDLSNQRIPSGGTAVIALDAIRPSTAASAALQAFAPPGTVRSLVTKIRLRGYYDDGSRFETGEFPTAIQVCNGCLPTSACAAGKVACPSDGMDPVGCGST